MNRLETLTLSAVLALVSGPAWARPSGGGSRLEPLQRSFKTHQVGAPYLDAAGAGLESLACPAGGDSCQEFRQALGRGRDVQEGCSEPCDAASQVAVYRAKILLVCEDLVMDEPACGQAEANYIQGGVARKRGSSASPSEPRFEALARLLADRRLDPGLRSSLGDKALGLAKSLGRAGEVAADSAGPLSVVPKPGGPAKAGKPGRSPASGKEQGPAPAPAVLSDLDVDRIVSANLGAQFSSIVSKNPVGRAVVQRVRRMPIVGIGSLPDETHARYDDEAGLVEFNVTVIAEILQRAGKVTVEDPEDAMAVKRLLVQNPALYAVVARRADSLYVHELTHAAQFQGWGEGLVGRAVSWARHKLNGDKYPVEYEIEASGNELAYFHNKVQADPAALEAGESGDGDLSEYQDWLADLRFYRKQRKDRYLEECGELKDLKLYGWERRPMEQRLKAQADAWPRQSYDGLMFLARRKAGMPFPAPALDLLGKAYDRASENGFLLSTKAEMKEILDGLAARFEETLSKSSSYSLGDEQKANLRKLSAGLGVPLPPKTAAAAGSLPAPSKKTEVRKPS